MAAKAISVCTDEQDRITGLCLDDLSGNTGWAKTTVGTLKLDIDAELYDDHGACLYRLAGKKAILRTEEERMADWPEEEAVPEDEVTALRARVNELEQEGLATMEALAEVYEMILGG